MRRTLTTKEAAEVLGVHPETLLFRARKGTAPPQIMKNKFSRKQIEDFADTGSWRMEDPEPEDLNQLLKEAFG